MQDFKRESIFNSKRGFINTLPALHKSCIMQFPIKRPPGGDKRLHIRIKPHRQNELKSILSARTIPYKRPRLRGRCQRLGNVFKTRHRKRGSET